jgi:hypothetical protein
MGQTVVRRLYSCVVLIVIERETDDVRLAAWMDKVSEEPIKGAVTIVQLGSIGVITDGQLRT